MPTPFDAANAATRARMAQEAGPKTEDYLGEIRARRDAGEAVSIHFGQLPKGVDRDAIAKELALDLPDDYGAEIGNRLKTGTRLKLDFGQVERKPLDLPLEEGVEAAGRAAGGIRDLAQKGAQAIVPGMEDLIQEVKEADLSQVLPTAAKTAGSAVEGVISPASMLTKLKDQEEKLTGLRGQFSKSLELDLERALAEAQALAPVEEGPQPVSAILDRMLYEGIARGKKFAVEQMPVTPLEMVEFAGFVKFTPELSTYGKEFAKAFPRLYTALTSPAIEALPYSVQSAIQSLKFKIKKGMGVPQETSLVPQEVNFLAEAVSDSTSSNPAVLKLREYLQKNKISKAKFIEGDTRLFNEELRRRGVDPRAGAKIHQAGQEAAVDPGGYLDRSIQDAAKESNLQQSAAIPGEVEPRATEVSPTEVFHPDVSAEQAKATPSKVPQHYWSPDKGAIPGEPEDVLTNQETGEEIAAIIEVEHPQTGAKLGYKAVLADGREIPAPSEGLGVGGLWPTNEAAQAAVEEELLKAAAPKELEGQPYKDVKPQPDSRYEGNEDLGSVLEETERGQVVQAGDVAGIRELLEDKSLAPGKRKALETELANLEHNLEATYGEVTDAAGPEIADKMRQRVEQIVGEKIKPPEPPKVVKEEGKPLKFQKGKFEITRRDTGPTEVSGYTYGELGIHKQGTGYTVSHLRTGLALQHGLPFPRAKDLAKKMARLDLRFGSPEEFPADTIETLKRIIRGEEVELPPAAVGELAPVEAPAPQAIVSGQEIPEGKVVAVNPGGTVDVESGGIVVEVPEEALTPVEEGDKLEGREDAEPARRAEGPGTPGEPGVSPLGGVPPQEVQGAPGERGTEVSPSGSRKPDQRGDGGADPEAPEAGLHERTSRKDRLGDAPRGVAAAAPRGKPAGLNHQITAADKIGSGGPVEKYKANVTAIKLLKEIEAAGRLATAEEQKILARYVGWGSLADAFKTYGEPAWVRRAEELRELLTDQEYDTAQGSTLNAHFTSFEVVDAIWKGIRRMGFQGGRVLEPSMGVGNFFGIMPRDLMWTSSLMGVELDSITGRLAKQLYQTADIRVSGFENVKIPDNFFDLAISNVPFGDYPIADKAYARSGMASSIHNYFFAKSLDKVRPGGLVVFITSRYTLDSKDGSARRYLAERADLVDAFRLPKTAFKDNAGTEVVTDLLIFRKKVPGETFQGQTWLEIGEKALRGVGTFQINEYFIAHPEKMLGKPSMSGTLYSAKEFTLEPTKPLSEALPEALAGLPEGLLKPYEAPIPTPESLLPAPGDLKEGSLTIQEGKAYQNVSGQLVPLDVDLKHLGAALEVREALKEVQLTQLRDAPEPEIQAAQKALERAYDQFVKKFGRISDRGTAAILRGDPEYPLLKSLEIVDPETKNVTKADIFSKRVISPIKTITKVETAKEALVAVLNQLGRVDLKRMSELSGKSEDQIKTELKGQIFNDPERGWVQAEAYLSGNVRRKLEAAEAAAKSDPAYQESLEAIKAVQPKDLEPGEIEVRLGAPWVPGEDIQAFIEHLTEVSRGLSVFYTGELGTWTVEVESYANFELANNVGNMETWGTNRYPAVNLIRDALNGKIPTVYDKVDEKTRVVNAQETAAAREKQEKLREEFSKWIFDNLERRERLVKYYNENFNNYRPREYDGSHLDLPGITPLVTLRPHQKNGIWRVVSSEGNTLLAHVVGAGKTYTSIAAGMELRRLGLRKKPMFAVPNHLLAQWEGDFRKLYPGAKILAANEKDFTPENRKAFMSKIATGDWDAVIVAHSSFQFLPMSRQYVENFFHEQMDLLDVAIQQAVQSGQRRRGPTVKQLEKSKKRLEAKLEMLLNKELKDQTVNFEEFGVDHLFVDEAQEFKNLFYYTQMSRVAGLSNPTGSYRAFDMFMKTRYLNALNGGKGVTFATGTPITNTIGEMFHMQKYLQEKTLVEAGIHTFDAWAKMFGTTISKMELATEGGNRFVSKTRFAKFVNVHELLNRYLEVADVKTADMLNLPRPKLKGKKPITVAVEASDRLKEFVKKLGARADKIRQGKVDPSQDNMLKVSSDGRKAALDMRLLDLTIAEDPTGKVNTAIQRVHEIWKAGEKDKHTQLIFADMGIPGAEEEFRFDLYGDIRGKLVSLGVPKAQIAFIHEADTKAKRDALFAKVRSGSVRVLIGSTRKMGTGMNVQTRLKALHHLDAPWRPDEVEQREGRILRQGNLNEEVEIYRYVTTGSFDTNLWQILENKAGFIGQLAPGRLAGRSIEDTDDAVLSYEEVKAIATGDKTIVEKFEVDNEVRKLQLLESSHRNTKFRAQSNLAQIPHQIASAQGIIKSLETDKAAFEKLGEEFAAELEEQKFTKKDDFGTAVIGRVEKMVKTNQYGEVSGTFKGLPLTLRVTAFGLHELMVKATFTYTGMVTDSAAGTAQSLEHAIKPETLEKRIEVQKKEIAVLEKKLKDLQKELEKPFEHEKKLQELLKRKKALDTKLGLEKSDVQASADDAPDEKSAVEPNDEPEIAEARGFGGMGEVRKSSGRRGGAEGNFLTEFPVELGGMGQVKPLEMPELVKLARELSGQVPQITKRLRLSRGMFKGQGPEKRIFLNPEIFKNPQEAAAVLAHEIGHLVDYLPHDTLKRGNLLGSLLSLNSFMRNTFGTLSVTNKELRKELTELSEWWRPYDKANAPDAFKAYRNSARELYADAISVLLNTPGILEKRAPGFYKTFFDALDRKPEVKKVYFELQDFLNGRGEDIVEGREKDVREMFAKGEELSKLKFMERKLKDMRLWERIRMAFSDRNAVILDKINALEAKGQDVPEHLNPKFALQENGLVENEVFLMLDRIDREIVRPLQERGLTTQDLGLVLFFDRIRGDRSGLANPLGHNPKTAVEQLKHLEDKIGSENFQFLRGVAKKLHDMNFGLVEEAVRVGTYNKETFENVILPNREFYASFQVLDYIEDFVPAGVRAQIGTLKEINNPLITTVLKMISLAKLNSTQRAKISIREFLKTYYPGEIEEAAVKNPGDKLKQFKEKEDRGVLTMLEDGKMVGYHVDPFIAESFEKLDLNKIIPGLSLLRAVNTGFFHPLLVTYNPGFFGFNAIRDFKRTLKGLNALGVKVSVGQLLKEMYKDLPTAKKRALGTNDELMEEILENKAMQSPIEDFLISEDEDQYGRLLAKHNLFQGKDKRGPLRRTLGRVLEVARQLGQTVEALPKIAGYNLLKEAGQSGKTLAYNTRNFIGTPNWMIRGRATQLTNGIFMYSNIFLQSFKADYYLASNPKTRSGWWWKTIQLDLLPKFLMAVAGATVLKEFYDRVTEYDKTNYICIPLGILPGGEHGWKAVYLRIPHDESARLISGIFWKMTRGLSAENLVQTTDFGAGQLPNISPFLTGLKAWKDYFTGKNPYDDFRGRPVISELEFKAGGWPKLKKMIQWSFNQTGLFRFATYDASSKSTFEATLEVAPALNRLIRVSDYGLTEKAGKEILKDERALAQFKLQRSEEARAFTRELARLQRLDKGDALSEKGQDRLRLMESFKRRFFDKMEGAMKDAIERGDEKELESLKKDVDEQLKGLNWRESF